MTENNNNNERGRVDRGRRRFLKSVGLAGAGTAAAVTVSTFQADATETPEEQMKGRYRDTPHVERFYFLNRL